MGEFSIIERAYIVGVLIALCAPLIGSFVVMRRYSLLSDVLAHVSLLGVAVGLVCATQPLVVSVVIVVVASLVLEELTRRDINSDVVLSLMMSGALALSVIIAHFSPKGSYALMGYMFGSLATIDEGQMLSVFAMALGVIGVIVVFYRQFVWVTLDREVASVMGVNVHLISTLMIVCAAIFVVVAMRLVGGLMVGALLVIPVVAAMNFRLPLHGVMIVGVCFSVLSMVSGVSVSLYYNVPSGAAVVTSALMIYALSAVIGSKKGL